MRFVLITFFILLFSCTKPQTILICGDHKCVNKAEAEQYFEENLTLEVKIIDKKRSKEDNLVEINLNSNSSGKKEVSIFNKKQTSKKLKELSNSEIKRKKAEIRKKKKLKDTKITKQAKLKEVKKKKKPQDSVIKRNKVVNNTNKKITDICTILEKCSIDEISKYLV